jgi:cell division protein FtsL
VKKLFRFWRRLFRPVHVLRKGDLTPAAKLVILKILWAAFGVILGLLLIAFVGAFVFPSHITDALGKVMTPAAALIVGIVTALIAYQQARTAANQAEIAAKQLRIATEQANISSAKLRLDRFNLRRDGLLRMIDFARKLGMASEITTEHVEEGRILLAEISICFSQHAAAHFYVMFKWVRNNVGREATNQEERELLDKEVRAHYNACFAPMAAETRIENSSRIK